jgi:hypothetical protein
VTLAPFSPEEVARTHADVRPGYELISYGEVGLPYFELRLRAQILERKELDPFAEFVARCLSVGISDATDVQRLLGLDNRVLEATVVDLIVKEQVALGDGESRELRLTSRGQQVVADAEEIRPMAAHLMVNFDGLLQEVVAPFGDYLQPRQLKEYGIREIPLPSKLQPELHRLDVRDVERVVRQVGMGRDQLRDILALKSMRRFRVFRPAVALVYRSETSPDTQVALALDGQLSERHSLAFAEAGLPRKLGIGDNDQRAEERIAPVVGREVAKILGNSERNERMREIKRAMRAVPAQAPAGEEAPREPGNAEELRSRAERAQEIFEGTEIKAIDTFEHPDYLRDALANSRKRLIIVSPWLRSEVMDHKFMSQLENLLHRGVDVHIGWGISKDEREEPNADRRVLRKLHELSGRYQRLDVQRLGNTHAKVLISDDRYVIVTSFNWLSFRGDPKRTFRDERGTLVSKPEYVQTQSNEWLERFVSAAG